MGIFSRFKDIVSSNISNMLDHAEDPEKLIKLMLREMEETLVELKASCASTMAEAARVRRAVDSATAQSDQWEHRAELALKADREAMAREAMEEKIRVDEQLERLNTEMTGFEDLVGKCREDIRLLEERIQHTRERQRLMVERHNSAQIRRTAREQVRTIDNSESLRRFEELDQRIARMENEADLAYIPQEKHADFRDMEHESAVTEQLDALRKRLGDSE